MVYKVHSITPVMAKLIAVADINKIVIFIIQIRDERDTKYVSRRYSEFRQLMKEIQSHAIENFERCDICNEVVSLGLNRSDGFPRRKLLHTESLAVSRFDELSIFLKNLMITTQGLLDANCAIPEKMRDFFLLGTSSQPTNDDDESPMRSLLLTQLRIIHQTKETLDRDIIINSPPTNALHRQNSLVIYQ